MKLRIVLIFLTLIGFCHGQNIVKTPHVAYVYPAGIKRGETSKITLAGKNLRGTKAVIISGKGLSGKILEETIPFTRGEATITQKRFRDSVAVRLSKERGKDVTVAEIDKVARQEMRDNPELRKTIREGQASYFLRQVSTDPLADTVDFLVTADKNAELGEYCIMMITNMGISNPMSFMVSDLPEVTEKSLRDTAKEMGKEYVEMDDSKSKRLGKGGVLREFVSKQSGEDTGKVVIPQDVTDMKITLPTIVNGQITTAQEDRYLFRAKKGERIVIYAMARALVPYISDAVPGWFQAAVTIYDSDKNEIAYNDDFLFHPDPMLCLNIPKDGEYTIEIKDALYRGREDFIYRLVIGQIPFVTSIHPLGSEKGMKTEISLYGWNLPKEKISRTFTEEKIYNLDLSNMGILHAKIPFQVSGGSLQKVDEDRDINLIKEGCIVDGIIEAPNKINVYELIGLGSEKIVVETYARRLNSPLDSFIEIVDEDEKVVMSNDDFEDAGFGLITHHADSRVEFTPQIGKRYFVRVMDSQSRGGSEFAYRLHAHKLSPNFDVRIVPSSINMRCGETVTFNAHLLRKDGFEGEVKLSLKNAPKEIFLGGAIFQKGQDRLTGTITILGGLPTQIKEIEIEGSGIANGSQITKTAIPCDDLMQAFYYRHLIPSDALRLVVLGVAGKNSMLTRRFGKDFNFKKFSERRIKIPKNGTYKMLFSETTGINPSEVEVVLRDAPDGISVKGVDSENGKFFIILNIEGEKVKQRSGNLIFTFNMVNPKRTNIKRESVILPAMQYYMD